MDPFASYWPPLTVRTVSALAFHSQCPAYKTYSCSQPFGMFMRMDRKCSRERAWMSAYFDWQDSQSMFRKNSTSLSIHKYDSCFTFCTIVVCLLETGNDVTPLHGWSWILYSRLIHHMLPWHAFVFSIFCYCMWTEMFLKTCLCGRNFQTYPCTRGQVLVKQSLIRLKINLVSWLLVTWLVRHLVGNLLWQKILSEILSG